MTAPESNREPIGFKTVHRCSDCGHNHLEHRHPGARCSFGWCPCTRSRMEVQSTEASVEMPIFDTAPQVKRAREGNH